MDQNVENKPIKAAGNGHLLRYRDGERLTRKAAILAKCADCMGEYADGRRGCQVSVCPLFPYSPYRREATDGKS